MTENKRAYKRKLNSSKGFTIAEMLVAIIILLLVSSVVVAGIPVARGAYERVVLASNAEIMMSTSISALRNELGCAKDIKESDTEIVYYSSARGTTSKISAGTSDIMIQRYYSDEGFSAGSDEVGLISSDDPGKETDFHVNFGGVDYDETTGVITFTGLTVSRETTQLLERDVSIRVISQEK